MDITVKVRNLIEPVLKENGFILDDVVYEKEGKMYFLRIIIDKEGIVNLEDCVFVSKLINPIIDESDPISDNYIMDVCSKEKGCE